MVKHLRICWTAIKRLVLLSTMALLALGFWLHSGERSLDFTKPWVLAAINAEDAPYRIGLGTVSIDWRDAAKLANCASLM